MSRVVHRLNVQGFSRCVRNAWLVKLAVRSLGVAYVRARWRVPGGIEESVRSQAERTGNGDNGEVARMGPYMGQVLTEVFTGDSASRRPTGRHRRPTPQLARIAADAATDTAATAVAPERSGSLSRWLRGLAPARRSWQRQPDTQ